MCVFIYVYISDLATQSLNFQGWFPFGWKWFLGKNHPELVNRGYILSLQFSPNWILINILNSTQLEVWGNIPWKYKLNRFSGLGGDVFTSLITKLRRKDERTDGRTNKNERSYRDHPLRGDLKKLVNTSLKPLKGLNSYFQGMFPQTPSCAYSIIFPICLTVCL